MTKWHHHPRSSHRRAIEARSREAGMPERCSTTPMGWETRRGGRYLYHKRRSGGRVVSAYVGHGEAVEALAGLEQANRTERAIEREARREQRAREQAEEAALDEVSALIEALATGALLAAGYHTHKGTWRRRR